MSKIEKEAYDKKAKEYGLHIKWADSVYILDEEFDLYEAMYRMGRALDKGIEYLNMPEKYQLPRNLTRLYQNFKMVRDMMDFLHPAMLKHPGNEYKRTSYELVREGPSYEGLQEKMRELAALIPLKHWRTYESELG